MIEDAWQEARATKHSLAKMLITIFFNGLL